MQRVSEKGYFFQTELNTKSDIGLDSSVVLFLVKRRKIL